MEPGIPAGLNLLDAEGEGVHVDPVLAGTAKNLAEGRTLETIPIMDYVRTSELCNTMPARDFERRPDEFTGDEYGRTGRGNGEEPGGGQNAGNHPYHGLRTDIRVMQYDARTGFRTSA